MTYNIPGRNRKCIQNFENLKGRNHFRDWGIGER
jgi:hypothetical protein